MAHPHWPLFDLVVRTPRLELRYPDDDMVVELADVAARGIHHPDVMPFSFPWTRTQSPELERSALKHWWGRRASWSPTNWSFPGAVIVDGNAIGIQDVFATDFAVTKLAQTGSWLGQDFHNRGIGKEMRAAVLHLAFAGLGAELAYSGAFDDNPSSLAVSRALGYEENGDEILNREGKRARVIRLKLTRQAWEQSRRTDIEIVGLDACRDWFGA